MAEAYREIKPSMRTLMGPGPSNVAPSVLQAMSAPVLGHLDPVFIKMMGEIKAMLREVFQTQNEMTFPVSGTGSAGMEFCFVNLIEPGDEGFEALLSRFPRYPGTRSIIRVSLTRIADSCGFGVPLYHFEGDRTQLVAWAERKGEQGLREYQLRNNRSGLDALPALRGEKL